MFMLACVCYLLTWSILKENLITYIHMYICIYIYLYVCMYIIRTPFFKVIGTLVLSG